MDTQAPDTAQAGGTEGRAIDWPDVLDRHGRWLRTVVLARTGEPQAVDEVMQEVAVAVVQSPARPTDADKIAPWLYRVAVRQALLYRRRMGRRRRLHGRYADRMAPGEADSSPDPLAWLLADEQRRLVRTALKRLPGKDAEILLLKYTEDWTYRRIAERLDISESAVESRLHRARARLRAELTALNVIEANQ